MNERIQELARQAGAQHRLNLGVEEFCFEHHELQKLAELIVRECAELVDRAISDGGVDGRVVKEHFGVEE